jgi:hypothetical protein
MNVQNDYENYIKKLHDFANELMAFHIDADEVKRMDDWVSHCCGKGGGSDN